MRAGPQRSPLAAVAVYAATALLFVALFFLLHHFGNQIDYRTAAHRFAAEFRTGPPDEGIEAGFKNRFDYCKLSVMVMAGAQPAEHGSHALRDAVLLRELIPMSQHYDFCAELEAAANGEVLHEQFTSPQYWFGSKAVYALLLRGLSAADVRALMRYGAYAGWIALAIALLLLAPRALVVVAPLIVFGVFFSGIRYFSDIPDGVPYLWAVWASVALVILLRVRLRVARLFCFFSGMVLCYLYVSAGPSILMVTLIGMLVYFVRGGGGERSGGVRLAGGCMALCAAGFAAAFALGQAAKLALEACLVPDWYGWRAVCEGVPTDRWVWRILSEKVLYVLVRTVLEATGGLSRALQATPALAGFAELVPSPGHRDGSLQALIAPRLQAQTQSWMGRAGVPIVQHFEPYWQVGLGSATAGRVLIGVAAGSLAAAISVAVVRARRKRPAALRGVGWIAALMALAGLLFLEPNDLVYRFVRYLFVLYALALCCALATVTETRFATHAADTAARALAGSAIVRCLARSRRTLAGSVIARRLARLDGLSLLLGALAGVGALLVLLRQTTFGPGLTSDSALYVSAARSLLDGDGLVTFLGAPYREAGPLFPLALAAAAGFGADPVTAAGLLNAAAFGLTVYVVAAWVRSRVRVRLVAVWAGCACALSTALAGAAAHVWPETLFILFAVVSLAALDRFLRTRARPSLLLAAAAAAAAGLTHHAGAALIGGGALLLLLPGTAGWRSRSRSAALFGAVSAAPLGAWLAGNLVLTGAAFGAAGHGAFAPLESLHAATGEIGLWLLGRGGLDLLDRMAAALAGAGDPSAPAIALRASLLLAAAAAGGYALRRRRSSLAVPLVFAAAYALYLLIALPAGRAALESRHLTPLFPPLLVTAALIPDAVIRRVRAARPGLSRRPLAVALLAALWFAPQVGAAAEHAQRQHVSGAGYASRQWAESEVVGYLNAHRPPGAIYGTDPAALYLLTAAAHGISKLPPGRGGAWDRLSADVAAGREYLVAWFHRDREPPYDYNYGLETLLRTPGMEIVTILDDGVILHRSVASTARTAARDAAAITPALLQDARIGLRSGFTVHLNGAADRLIYTKYGCRRADVETRFFLHVVPRDYRDRPRYGSFHRLDFDFADHGFTNRGLCVAVRALPEFPIARIDTGQFTPRDGQLWKVTLEDPAAPRGFAIHLLGDKLIYRKEPCSAADARARFFLRLRRPAGDFDNLDFDLREYGWTAGESCRAVVPLPVHEVADVRTGQYGPAGGEPLWTAEFTASRPPPTPPPKMTIAKWFGDHAAAISITYDRAAKGPSRIDDLALDLGLVLDYELVSQRYVDRAPDWVEHDLTELIPDAVPGDLYPPLTDEQIAYGLSLTGHGFGFFGHGHWHVDHDALSYAQAYQSFRLNFEVMESLGLKPVAYAYPRGAGEETETRQALADAGFLAGRRSYIDGDESPYIVPDYETVPENWFFLPALTMESIDFRQCEWCVNNTPELTAHLRQALRSNAWIIPVYHAIGSPGNWGFYDWEDFQTDLRAIASRDFWVAPMNDVVLYLRERASAEVTMQVSERTGVTHRIDVLLTDGLDNDRFDLPLTLLFRRPADWFDLPVEVTQHGRVVARIPAFTETAKLSLLPNEEPYLLQPAYSTPGTPEVTSQPEPDVMLGSGAAEGAPGVHGVARHLLNAGISQQSEFTVYLDAAAGRLIYTRTGCRAADTAARFFLHVFPVSDSDLPAGQRFHNLDFDFGDQGLRDRGYCVAARALPDFPIARIDTGQYTPRGRLWTVTLAEPAARRDFAVHLRGNALIYLKEPCTAADAQPRFFLDLRRREGGSANLNFDLREYGWAVGERCRAVAPLPAYEVAGIRTGQYDPGGGELWTAEFTASRPPPAPLPTPTIAKWFDDHTAAISITYDGAAVRSNAVDDLAQELGLALDYEMVTQRYRDRVPDWVEHDLTELIPDAVPGDLYEPLTDEQIAHGLSLTDRGSGFYGHGHWHVDHDALSYAQAYQSFRLNFEVMERLGLKPVAYAYPRGAGEEAETQQALADAGFLAGRRSYIDADETPYIVPDDDKTPENWFFLPALTMESIHFRRCDWCVNDTWELLAHLRQALRSRAWIIPVYHNIGGSAWEGWGFYDWDYFQADLEAIAAQDFWVAPMNDVVLYLREREQAEVTMQVSERDGVTQHVELVLADGLDNDRFDQPLTVLFTPPADWFGAAVEAVRNGQVIDRIPAGTELARLSLLPDEEPYRLQPAAPQR